MPHKKDKHNNNKASVSECFESQLSSYINKLYETSSRKQVYKIGLKMVVNFLPFGSMGQTTVGEMVGSIGTNTT